MIQAYRFTFSRSYKRQANYMIAMDAVTVVDFLGYE